MRWITAVLTALIFVGVSLSELKAQTIAITVPVTVKGKITIEATVTLPAKWTFVQVELFAKPPKGAAGEGGDVIANAKKGKAGVYSGIVIVPPNKFDVYAILTAKDPEGDEHFYYSATTLNVDATGGG